MQNGTTTETTGTLVDRDPLIDSPHYRVHNWPVSSITLPDGTPVILRLNWSGEILKAFNEADADEMWLAERPFYPYD